jgi:hypothetical protein
MQRNKVRTVVVYTFENVGLALFGEVLAKRKPRAKRFLRNRVVVPLLAI